MASRVAGGERAGGGSGRMLPAIVWDAGDVDQNVTVEHLFRIPNERDVSVALSIDRVSCSCTAVTPSSSTVPAGGQGEVLVRYNVRRRVGRVVQTVIVRMRSETGLVENLPLELRCDVKPTVEWYPERIEFGRVFRASHASQVVTVWESDDAYRVTGVECSVDGVDVSYARVDRQRVRRHQNQGRRSPCCEVYVEATPGLAPGPFEGEVRIFTTSPTQPVLTVPLTGIVSQDVFADPPTAFLGVLDSGAELKARVSLWRVAGVDVNVRRVECSAEEISVQYIEASSNVMHEPDVNGGAIEECGSILVSAEGAGITGQGMLKERILVKTDNPDTGDIVVPVILLAK